MGSRVGDYRISAKERKGKIRLAVRESHGTYLDIQPGEYPAQALLSERVDWLMRQHCMVGGSFSQQQYGRLRVNPLGQRIVEAEIKELDQLLSEAK